MAETERIVRPDVPVVSDDAEPTLNSVPAFLSSHVMRFLEMEGIEAKLWSWGKIKRGQAPIDAKQACEGLRDLDEAGIVAIAPEVIESPLTHEQMTLLCRQMFVSEWYAKREIWGNGVKIPKEMQIPLFEAMTTPGRTMRDDEREWALNARNRNMSGAED